ncbi:hypothetical protein BABINDRAFT_162109 [Babjeviella inositovora NRRL Y-12698]|uniref:REM-1 domain-containing protein n=1 Tax=Babjeviella inositovora NRRL Y-12698 TaxID=984486 RepID=A0A1E3QMW9_9ASCO|nr:uncharacterized protein BABINDRAFT_162109 [Babjeviella inositovora NRRL Y-12698]ODQ79039.1 hypothetical protein BABINDRAFT_162109 [Babjeviella inositovora NRRL Y-12698]
MSSLLDLQNDLQAQKSLRDSVETIIHAADNNKYQDIRKLKKLRHEAQSKATELNRSIVAIERRIEALKRVEPSPSTDSLSEEPAARSSFDTRAPSPFVHLSLPAVVVDTDPGESTWALNELLQALGAKEREAEFYVSRGNALIALLRQHPAWTNDLELLAWGHRIQNLLVHGAKEVLATAYRLARYVISDVASLRTLTALRIQHFVVASLARDPVRFLLEREHALKFVRRFIEVEHGAAEIHTGVLRALIAVAEQNEDRLRTLCLETLCELAVVVPERLFFLGGMRVLMHVVSDGPYEISGLVGVAIVHMLDRPCGRACLRGGADVGAFLAPFTDVQIKGHVNTERLQHGANVLTTVLKAWPGLVAFLQRDFQPVRDLLNCLVFAIPVLRDVVMDVVFDVLHIRQLPWTRAKAGVVASAPRTRVVSHYVALLLAVLLRCDVLRLLSTVMDGGDELNARKAAYLYAEVHFLAATLLPETSHVPQSPKTEFQVSTFEFPKPGVSKVHIQDGPFQEDDRVLIVDKSVNFTSPSNISTNGDHVNGAFVSDFLTSDALSCPDPSYTAFGGAASDDTSVDHTFSGPSFGSSFSIEKMTRRLQKPRRDIAAINVHTQLAKSKSKQDVDDAAFRQMILDTRVLSTKSFARWNWDVLTELAQGPLRNPRRYDEVLKTTKLFKRISSFFRPFKYRFSTTKRAPGNERYTAFGCEFFKMLLSFPEGARTLAESKLLRQIAECLAQVDAYSGITAAEPLFSKQRLLVTLSPGYFRMLGVLSADPAGLAMLESWKFFSMFYHIVERSGREDLALLILSAVDYSQLSHLRTILGKAMATCGVAVRLHATRLAASLLYAPQTQTWAARALVAQLYDTDVEVCEVAVAAIHAYGAVSRDNLDHILRLRPSLDHLSRATRARQLLYLATPRGFRYLTESEFVQDELDRWEATENVVYAKQMERSILTQYCFPAAIPNTTAAPGFAQDAPNFFGELVKTDEGCNLLLEQNILERHVSVIRASVPQDFSQLSPADIQLLKASLWVLANIGSTSLGVLLLEDHGVIPDIIDICRHSDVWSLKGVAFYALGFVARTEEGAEVLDELDWCVKADSMQSPVGVSLPRNITDYFFVDSANALTISTIDPEALEDESDSDRLVAAVIQRFKELGSTYSWSERSTLRDINKIKEKYGEVFEAPELLVRTLDMLAAGHYRMNTRRTILEYFGGKVWELMVKRERRRRLSGNRQAD